MSACRDNLRREFLARHRWSDARIQPLTPDASFRRYLRLRKNGATSMLMDAPPPEENIGQFVAVTRHLADLGVRVPAILAFDQSSGFLLLEDLGDHTFTRLLAEGHDQDALYRQAIDVLTHIARQREAAAAIDLPIYDTEIALSEANLLLDWYIPARREQAVAARARDEFRRIWTEILTALPPLPPVLVLRDYHIDNLMLCGGGGECAVLDYQDAVIGSPAYDLVSLLEDARRDVPPTLADDMTQHYLAHNRDMDADHLRQHWIVWGAQRHCKVAGIFVRLWLRDGKDAYLRHLPRVMKLLRRNLRQPEMEAMRRWLEDHLGEIDHIPINAPRARLLRHCAPPLPPLP